MGHYTGLGAGEKGPPACSGEAKAGNCLSSFLRLLQEVIFDEIHLIYPHGKPLYLNHLPWEQRGVHALVVTFLQPTFVTKAR